MVAGVGARQLSEVPPELVGGGRQLLDGGDDGGQPLACALQPRSGGVQVPQQPMDIQGQGLHQETLSGASASGA